MVKKEKQNKLNKIVAVTLLCITFIVVIFGIIGIFINGKVEVSENIKLIINYTDVTNFLKGEVFRDDNGVIYLSKEDIQNFYDEFIYYDKNYNKIITTSKDKILVIDLESNKKEINGVESNLQNKVILKNDKYFIPFSELEEIYNVKANYYDETNTIVIDSLDRKLTVAESKKKNNVKYKYSFSVV